jgi:hypothetical protein
MNVVNKDPTLIFLLVGDKFLFTHFEINGTISTIQTNIIHQSFELATVFELRVLVRVRVPLVRRAGWLRDDMLRKRRIDEAL